LHTDIKEAGPFERVLTIRIGEDELEAAKKSAARKLARTMKVKGFRPGKVPAAMVERMVGADRLRSEAIEGALPDLVGPALEEAELEPAATPRVEEVRDGEGGGVDVDVKITLWPMLDAVPDFAGREVEIDAPDVTEAEIELQIDRLRNQYAELEGIDRPAVGGDFVMINITAFDNGVEVEEATAADLLYEVESGSFIRGLDEILLGASPGDIREGPGTLPPGFGVDEAREVNLRILVKEVRAKKLPEVTDDWISDVSEFDTVAELTERIRTNLAVMKADMASSNFRTKLIDGLSDELALEIPEALIDAEMESSFHKLAHTLETRDIEFDDYLRITGQDEQQFVAEVRERAVRSLKTRVLLDSVAAIERLEVTEEDIDEAVAVLASEMEQDVEELREALRASGREGALAGDILRRKALDRIESAAVAVDDEGKPISLRPTPLADDIGEGDGETEETEED